MSAKNSRHLDWDEHFKNAHTTSWPLPGVSMSSDVYEREKEFVDKAAKKHGYRRQISGAKIIQFGKGWSDGSPRVS
jgi:hypothetical protein